MNRKDVDISKVTPMMKQYLNIKKKNEDIILFFRLGDFYEMFFEDAKTASRELEIALTGKNAGLDEKIPMCGIPHHSSQNYIEKLVEKGYKVGICEQTEEAGASKGVVKRELVRVITAGTVMNETILNENENNYIASILDFNTKYIISYGDISTGEFYLLDVKHNINNAITELISLSVKEVITDPKVDKKIIATLEEQFKICVTIFENVEVKESPLFKNLSNNAQKKSASHLLNYFETTQKRSLEHIQPVELKNDSEYLKMDIHTKRNLELTETLRLKQRNYSLLWLLDKTKTAMGSRMLKNWIENPLISKEKIIERFDIVEKLLNEFILKEELGDLLTSVYDLERLSGRVAFGNANARDLMQLKSSLKVLPDIDRCLKEINFNKDLESLDDLYQLIEKSIYENPPITIKEGYLIKEGYNQELDELKDIRKNGKDYILKFENEERERTGIKTLKVGFNRIFGYYIEVTRSNAHLITEEDEYERKQTLANCERFITPALKEKESLILGAEEKIVKLEYQLFIIIRDEIKKYIPTIQKVSKVISEIDGLLSFAKVAEENNYVRPEISDDRSVNIVANRHPVVEKVIKDEFVDNDIKIDEKNMLLITGPNMAGKSTFMRQMAINVIMTQIGSFIPAKKACLPVYDKIFTRIGASDDLVSGESTFMVEMTEANNAIKNATKNSLILFDELGRGTATYDGMSLAEAIIEYIDTNIKATTFFSTHYHELTDLEDRLTLVKNIHVAANEENGEITFLHKIKEGPADKSYGIHVAKLANLPDAIIKRASDLLSLYEEKEKTRDLTVQKEFNFDIIKEEAKPSEIEEIIKDIDPLNITPLEALNIITELKKKMED